MRSLPPLFLEEISRWPRLAPLASSLLAAPEVSLRLNRAKPGAAIAAAATGRVPWCDLGIYLGERPQFTFDPAMHQGCYYVQDASSMAVGKAAAFLAEKLGGAPLRYLDACAAPGGKSTAAIDSLPEGSLVVANEYDFKRAEILAENLQKWGSPCVVATRGDTARLRQLPDFFDIVAVDAPCSGEGMMRKDQQAIDQWSPSLVADCAATQRAILANAWASLKPGGYLIYSTCTFNRTENEENVEWIAEELGGEPVRLDPLEAYPEIGGGIDTPFPCYRFLPGRVKGEGLFLAALRKPEGHAAPLRIKAKGSRPAADSPAARWLAPERQWQFIGKGDAAYALPKEWAADMLCVAGALDALLIGVEAGSMKGRDLVPSQGLALSTALRPDAFPKVEIGHEQAIAYLQRQALAIDAPKGIVLLTYKGMPLGFAKNLGTRANNLYPKNWRILSAAPK